MADDHRMFHRFFARHSRRPAWLALLAGLSLAASVACPGGAPVNGSGNPTANTNAGNDPATQTDGTGNTNANANGNANDGNHGSNPVPMGTETVDESGVRWQWTADPPRFTTEERFVSALRIAAPVPIARVTVDGADVAAPKASEFELPIEVPVKDAVTPEHTVQLFAESEAAEVPAEPAGVLVSALTFAVVWDGAAPVIAVSRPSTAAGDMLFTRDAELLIEAVVTDAGGELATVTVGGQAISVPPNAAELAVSHFVEVAEGEQTVAIEVTDAAGHTATLSWPVTCDRTAPAIEITAPNAGQTSWVTPDETVTVAGIVRDATGAEKLEIAGAAVELVPGEAGTWTFSADLNLDDGQNAIDVRVSDKLGNENRLLLTIVKGDAGTELPTEVTIPPPPDDRFGTISQIVSDEGPTAQEAIANLQLKALTRYLTGVYSVSQLACRNSAALRRFADGQHVRVREWQKLPEGWRCDGELIAAEADVLAFISTHGASLTEAAERAGTGLGQALAEFPRAADWGLSAVAASDDRATVFAAYRKGADAQVRVHFTDGQEPKDVPSTLKWGQISALRRLSGSDSVLYLVGKNPAGDRQIEAISNPRETASAAAVNWPAGPIAWDSMAAQIAVRAGSKIQIRSLPEGAIVREIDAPALSQPIGFGADGATIFALGSFVDDFGVATPGTLFALDAQTGAVRSTHFFQPELLAAAPEFAPAPALASGDIATINQQLAAAIGGFVAPGGQFAVLTLPSAVMVIDVAGNMPVGPAVPGRARAKLLGNALVAGVSADGKWVALNGNGRAVLVDAASGAPMLELPGRIAFADSPNLLAVDDGAVVRVFGLPDPAAFMALADDKAERALVPGKALAIAIQARSGAEMGSELAASLRGELANVVRAQGYTVANESATTAGRIVVETWEADGRVQMRVALALGMAGPLRKLLGREGDSLRAGESPDAAFGRAVGKVMARLEPLPARLMPLPDAAFDLPRSLTTD